MAVFARFTKHRHKCGPKINGIPFEGSPGVVTISLARDDGLAVLLDEVFNFQWGKHLFQ